MPDKKSEKPLKAFSVLEENENTGGIIYATHAIAARRQGANEWADGDFSYVSCRRAPWADAYAGKPLPARDMIAHGWHFECSGCGMRIDEGALYDDNKDLEDVVGTQFSMVYCNPVCEAREKLRQAEANHHQNRWIRRFKKLIMRRLPDAKILEGDFNKPHAYAAQRNGRWEIEQITVCFEFPGMQFGPATLRYDRNYPARARAAAQKPSKPYYQCSIGDREAFEAYANSTKVERKPNPVDLKLTPTKGF